MYVCTYKNEQTGRPFLARNSKTRLESKTAKSKQKRLNFERRFLGSSFTRMRITSNPHHWHRNVRVLSCTVNNPSVMTSPADKKNQQTHRRMPPVLFPTRRFAIASRVDFAGRDTFSDKDDDANAVKWIGMNPLEMISHLARATEEAEAAKGKPEGPIRVGDTELSSETPPVPRFTKSDQSLFKKKRGATGTLSATNLTTEDEPTPLPPWDLSFLVANDQHAAQPVQHLQFLAHTVESMPHYALVGGSYQRIRAHVAGTASWIHTSYSGNLSVQRAAERMSLLHNLYAETIQQMEGLVKMTRMLGPEEEENAEPEFKEPLAPPEFADYMTQWLKNHWTNPYPDEVSLELVAHECGRTTTVVNNWLINARTRKWRPAVVKAFELKRPANLLLEDAINIFEDEPLRDLTEYEASQVAAQAPSNKRAKYEHN